MTNLENRRAYFAAKNEAYASPKGVYKTMSTDPDSIEVVDVRNPVERIPLTHSGFSMDAGRRDRSTDG